MMTLESRLEKVVGHRFGKWVVVGGIKRHKHHTFVFCRCDCGEQRWVSLQDMKSGHSSSCGCNRSEISKKSATIHGEAAIHTKTTEYRTWQGMKMRCYNKNLEYFKHYGGRGIKVCDRWLNSYENFLSDMGRKPTPAHSLDRYPDKNGDYEPGNCRWATKVEQSGNTRNTITVELYGVNRSLSEWSRIVPVGRVAIQKRLKKGWSVLEALATPNCNYNKYKNESVRHSFGYNINNY